MPPMATPPVKRKWSDLLEDETTEKQLLMDLCAAKLRYVNPPRPPKRRTEVPLLRSVLIVNAMKHLSSEMKTERAVDFSSEDLSVDPGHFEGLPPLSELLTDIMLDPQPLNSPSDPHNPIHHHQHQAQASFLNWPSPSSPQYSSLTPVQPSVTSYLDSESMMETGEEEKTVHNLLPCTSVLSSDPSQVSSSWEMSSESNLFDSFLSDTHFPQSPSDTLNNLSSDLTFQPSRNPLPSFTSLFDSTHSSATYTELSQMHPSPASTGAATTSSSLNMISPSLSLNSTEDSVGSANLSESELEILAMTLSAKLPTLSIEELVHALPQSAALSQQMSQTSTSSFFVPSPLQTTGPSADANPATNNQCASYCRKDQPPPSVDDGSMVRVLVNL